MNPDFNHPIPPENNNTPSTRRIENPIDNSADHWEVTGQLDDKVEFDERCRELFIQAGTDGDLIANQDFLDKLADLHPKARLEIAARAAGALYIGSNDFDAYFERFPEDARIVCFSIGNNCSFGRNPEAITWNIGCKMFEPAARFLKNADGNNYLDYKKQQIAEGADSFPFNKYLEISKRSILARDSLLGDYKNNFNNRRFERFGAGLAETVKNLVFRADNLYNALDWGTLDPSAIANQPEYKKLDPDQKTAFLEALIENCHNVQIYQEIYNSGFDDRSRQARPVHAGNRVVGRGVHSIIYRTGHDQSYNLNQFSDDLPEQVMHDTSSYTTDENGQSYRKLGERIARPDDISGTRAEDEFYANTLFADVERPVELNPYGQIISFAVRELDATPKTAEFCLNFWEKNRDPLYGPVLALHLSKLEATENVPLVLSRLKQAERSDQKRLLSLLYRLELGKVGISEEGLNYLGRKFDLGEHNSSDFAQRITADGKVGVFKDGQMQGFVQLEAADFTEEQTEAIRKYVTDVTTDLLFEYNPDETPEEAEQKARIVHEFKEKFYGVYIEGFPAEGGFHFNNLTLKDQGWALHFLANAGPNQKTQFGNYLSKFGEDGFRAFRAMEFGPEIADLVLEIEPKIGNEAAKELLMIYTGIIDTADNLSEHIKSQFKNDPNLSDQILKDIKLKILMKGYDILKRFLASPVSADSVLNEIKNLQTETLVFASTFKALRSQGEAIKLTDFLDYSLEVVSGSQISEATKKSMIDIFARNRADRPDVLVKFGPEFEKALTDSQNRFYLLRHKDQILGFFRLDQQENGELYLGSLNIDPNLQGSSLGDEILQQTFPEAAGSNIVHAEADPRIKITQSYIGKYGFVARGIKHKGDMVYFDMVWDKENSDKYEYFGKKYQEIDRTRMNYDEIAERHYQQADLARLSADCQALCNQGYVLTLYQAIPESQSVVCIYEKAQLPKETALPLAS
jgi:N-acetylglutamate synthase-like GNAT family acetyltransferase